MVVRMTVNIAAPEPGNILVQEIAISTIISIATSLLYISESKDIVCHEAIW